MNIDQAVWTFAGFVVLMSLALATLYSSWWLFLAAFVGVNMIQASISGFCPAAAVFRKLGVKPGNVFQ